MIMPRRARELMVNIDAIYRAFELRHDDAAKEIALSVFADWCKGIYGSRSDTDMFAVCPTAEDNVTRLVDFLAGLGESQGVIVFKASLDFVRRGLPVNLRVLPLPELSTQPYDQRAIYAFDNDTTFEQRYSLRDVQDRTGQRVCASSITNKQIVLPRNAFISRSPDHVSFNPTLSGGWHRVTVTEAYTLRAAVLIPKDRVRRALQLEKDVKDAISIFRRMGSSTSDRFRWELPFCLRNLPVEADCDRLLEILDISAAQGNSKVWREAMEILSRFKPINEIETARIVASVNKFSFAELTHLLGPFYARLTTVDEVTSFTNKVKQSSSMLHRDRLRRWCVARENTRIIQILGSDEKTIPSLVQYGFVKGLPLLSDFIRTLSQNKTVGFTFWVSLVGQLDRQWQAVNSASFTGAPVRELHSMVDDCVSSMAPLITEAPFYLAASPDLADDIRHNAKAHVERFTILTEICLRFSPHRCGGILFQAFDLPGDLRLKFDLFYRPLARSLRSLLRQYDSTIFRSPFFMFFRVLVGMYLSFYHADETLPGTEPAFCTKKVACDPCKLIADFLSSGDQSKALVLTNKEWSHFRYITSRLKDSVFPPTVTTMESGKIIQIKKRAQEHTSKHIGATKEFLRTIGDEQEISTLMEPLGEEMRMALSGERVFDFERCLRLPPHGSQTA